MDQQYSLFRNPGINQKYIDMPKADFSTAITKENPFHTTFDVNKSTSLPDLEVI